MKGKRSIHLRLDDIEINNQKLPREKPYSIVLKSSINVVAQLSRLDTTSENNGEFKIRFNDGNLISYGGIDLDSGILLDNLMLVHSLQGFTDFKVISPLTTVSAFFLDPTLVKNSLGIDLSSFFNPIFLFNWCIECNLFDL